MSHKTLIPQDAEADIFAKLGAGWTLRKIAAWLLEEKKIKTSAASLFRLIRKVQGERRAEVRSVVDAKLRGTVTTDLDAVGGALDRARKDEGRAHAALDAMAPGENETPVPVLVAGSLEWSRCMSAASAARADLLRSLELRFKLAGASDGSEGSIADLVLATRRPADDE